MKGDRVYDLGFTLHLENAESFFGNNVIYTAVQKMKIYKKTSSSFV